MRIIGSHFYFLIFRFKFLNKDRIVSQDNLSDIIIINEIVG